MKTDQSKEALILLIGGIVALFILFPGGIVMIYLAANRYRSIKPRLAKAIIICNTLLVIGWIAFTAMILYWYMGGQMFRGIWMEIF